MAEKTEKTEPRDDYFVWAADDTETTTLTEADLAYLQALIGDDGGDEPEPRHYAGKHDQSSHGNWAKAGAARKAAAAYATNEAANKMYSRINSDGGFTYQPLTDSSPTSGFAVALPGQEKIVPIDKLSVDTIKEYVAAVQPLLASDARNHVGGWLNTEDGKVYLDVSQIHTDREAALEVARQTNQLAIYDLGAGEEITTGVVRDEGRADAPAQKRWLRFQLSHDPDEVEMEASVAALRAAAGVQPEQRNHAPVSAASMARRRDFAQRHLPGKHDQKSHGSWAKGIGGADDPHVEGRRPEDYGAAFVVPTGGAAAQRNAVADFEGMGLSEATIRKNLSDLYDSATDEEKKFGAEWYPNAQALAAQFAIDYNIPYRNAAAALSALSTDKIWTDDPYKPGGNQAALRDVLNVTKNNPMVTITQTAVNKALKRGVGSLTEEQVQAYVGKRMRANDIPAEILGQFDVTTNRFREPVVKALLMVRQADDPANLIGKASKTPSFFNTFRDPNTQVDVVVDRWHIRAATRFMDDGTAFSPEKQTFKLGKDGQNMFRPKKDGQTYDANFENWVMGNAAKYDVIKRITLDVAQEKGVSPAVFQATIWKTIQRYESNASTEAKRSLEVRATDKNTETKKTKLTVIPFVGNTDISAAARRDIDFNEDEYDDADLADLLDFDNEVRALVKVEEVDAE